MKRTAVILVALLMTQMVWTLDARAQQPEDSAVGSAPVVAQAQPTLLLQRPGLELSRPRRGARHELMAGLGLSIASASLVILGGLVMAAGDRNGAFPAGLALSSTGAALAYPTVLTLLYGAGHNRALRELDGASADTIDRVEARARRIEKTGIGLFVGGLGLMLAGVGMVIGGLQGASFDYGREDHSNPALYWSGIAVALLGDATWFAGTLAWTYGGGVHRGVRQARGSLHATLGGVAGTF
jgi:hypothetical protein